MLNSSEHHIEFWYCLPNVGSAPPTPTGGTGGTPTAVPMAAPSEKKPRTYFEDVDMFEAKVTVAMVGDGKPVATANRRKGTGAAKATSEATIGLTSKGVWDAAPRQSVEHAMISQFLFINCFVFVIYLWFNSITLMKC